MADLGTMKIPVRLRIGDVDEQAIGEIEVPATATSAPSDDGEHLNVTLAADPEAVTPEAVTRELVALLRAAPRCSALSPTRSRPRQW